MPNAMLESSGENSIRLYTVGHSNHNIEDFLSILKAFEIRSLIDVRSLPSSTRYPQFDQQFLEAKLLQHGITYHWFQDLGGWRKGLGEDSPNKGLHEGGFRNYADYMLTDDFHTAAGRALGIARVRTTTIMCAEKDYTRCHRQYLSDYLVLHGAKVLHIQNESNAIHHLRTKHAAETQDHKLIYPPHNDPGQDLLFEP
ncbi:DUF488 family protein [Planctomycetota bacterium]